MMSIVRYFDHSACTGRALSDLNLLLILCYLSSLVTCIVMYWGYGNFFITDIKMPLILMLLLHLSH